MLTNSHPLIGGGNNMNDDMIVNQTPIETLLNAKNLANVLKAMFETAVLHTAEVKKGSGTSGNIYVPKKHIGKLATIIIWDKK